MVLIAFASAPADAGSGTHYPTGSWNGYKIYLSPSSQTNTNSCDSMNEAVYAMATADSATHISGGFLARSYQVRIGIGTLAQRIDESNNVYKPRYHIAIHSNGTVGGCNGTIGGTWVYNKYGNSGGSFLAQEIVNLLGPLSPGTSDQRRTEVLTETRDVAAVSVLVESGFHDYRPDKDWLVTYTNWAWKIAQAVDIRLGYPR